ncbi:hypothetical protein Nepgr_020471 [Nepenthes gracilis]|uniref:EF-hand domain-containing protein n=1 Tax=Nepenthes gracilis TaxID=150966 RepID=A0AAD3XWB1_NEPGR|nr:hypothetical protein Nepgr_020471 [Nepenthes gracilis]
MWTRMAVVLSDFGEFYHMMTAKMGERDTKGRTHESFCIINQDNNGKISASDIQNIAKELGEHFTDREIQDMVKEADQHRDGEVDVDDFLKMMKRTSYAY